jgi:hypothetical protein
VVFFVPPDYFPSFFAFLLLLFDARIVLEAELRSGNKDEFLVRTTILKSERKSFNRVQRRPEDSRELAISSDEQTTDIPHWPLPGFDHFVEIGEGPTFALFRSSFLLFS